MLLNIKAMNEAGRTFATWVAALLDKSKYDNCVVSGQRANLLTPIAKAFMTDQGLDACVTAQQVFGGHGYVKEWGMEQLVRDVRIAQIYEGTNGIQAADFMLRKVAADKGAVLFSLLDDIVAELADKPEVLAAPLTTSITNLRQLTLQLLAQENTVLAGAACDYLALVSYVLYGYMWYKNVIALDVNKHSKGFVSAKMHTANWYFSRILPRVSGISAVLSSDSVTLYTLGTENF